MAQAQASDRLRAEDAGFLYLEKEEMPLHIGSVSIFDGVIPFEALVEYVESRLPLIPRYRQRLAVPPLHVGHPTWEADPDFDIGNHVRHEKLKRGSERELRALAGSIFSRIMDRSKPLWDLTLVGGLRNGRCGLIARVHHCLVDGVSGVGLMNVLLNADGQASPAEKQRQLQAHPLPPPEASMLDALVSAWPEMVDRFLATQSAALNFAQALTSGQTLPSLDRLFRLAPELLTPVQRLPFNRPLAGPRRVAWSECSMAEIKAIRESLGGTVNDVVLTLVALAVRRYAWEHRVTLQGRLLRVMAPVNLRRNGDSRGVGNQVSFIPVSIPMDIADPAELLNSVQEQTESLKGAHVADLISLVAAVVGSTPAPIQALLGPIAAMLPLPPFNLVCTNVPGPQFPLYALGHEMLTYHPYVPIGSEMGVGCAIQSYNHNLYFGLTGDAGAAPDIDRLGTLLGHAFADLSKAAGLAPSQKRKPRRTALPGKDSAIPAGANVPAGR